MAVRGRSMAPTLVPGDRLLVARLGRAPQAGDIVLAPDPRDGDRELVKRVESVGSSGVVLLGDDPRWSTDARAFGRVPASAVTWRVVLRYWPPSRLGRISSSTPTGSEPAAHELSR